MTEVDLVQSLVSFLPPAVARALQHRPASCDEPTASRFQAAVLFSDVSGFTALTEKLAARGSSGAEELTALLNGYFTRMITLLEAEGGEVVQFSGDALMVVFPAETAACLPDSLQHAWQAAAQMQASMQQEFAHLATSLGPVELGMKISLGVGEVLGCMVGGIHNRWYYLIAGDPLTQVGEAEHRAQRGQIVFSPQAQALFRDAPVPSQPLPPVHFTWAATETLDRLRPCLPEVIAHRLGVGQANWLAEIRRLTVVFFSLQGLDYASAEALNPVQGWMRACQQAIYRYEGTLNKLLVDDKGTVGIALLGAPPLSHPDDPVRGVRCALDLLRAAEAQGLQISIGVTTGRVFAGPVGSLTRREYTVMGDPVNLAARLMQVAVKAGGGIRCDFATQSAADEAVEWETLPPEAVKGKVALVRVYRPLGLHSGAVQREPSALIGRDQEIAQITRVLDETVAGQMRVLCLESEPGMGRNRLLTELVERMRARNLVALADRGDALEQQTAYSAWREIFRSYFDLEGVVGEHRDTKVVERLAEIAPDTLERAPLLNDLLDLRLPENPLTSQLEPRLRQASLTTLLVDLLARWAAEQPLVIALEEAQWMDSLSWQVVLQSARGLRDLPGLLVLTLQPLPDLAPDHPYAQLLALSHCQRLILKPLDSDSIVAVAATRLGVTDLPAEAARLITQRAAGNPFVAAEIAIALRDNQLLKIEDGVCELTGYLNETLVPDTLQGLMLSKLDRLKPEAQLTLKVASVIGRTFGYRTLRDVYPVAVAEPELRTAFNYLTQAELVHRLDSDDQLYSHTFTQGILQEVTYGTLLSAQSRDLHERVAHWYEAYLEHAGAPQGFYPLLAYHWRQARRPERELDYAVRAGKELAEAYANHEALSLITRALELTHEPVVRRDLLWLQLDLQDRIGDRSAQHATLMALQALTAEQSQPKQRAQLANAWGDYYRSISDYPAAIAALQHARAEAQHAQDAATEARALTLWGQVLEHQGAYHEARTYFEQALTLYRALDYRRGEANNLSRLSSLERYLGNRVMARDYALQALRLRQAMGDRASEATSLTNLALIATELGDSEAARTYRQEALTIARAIGDRAGEALSLNTMGLGYYLQGDYGHAQRSLQQALRLHQAMGARLREAECQNILGAMWREVGDNQRARQCFEDAVAIQEAIGNRSYASYTYLNLGLALMSSDQLAALNCYQKALHYARETGTREAEAYALSYQGGWHMHMGNATEADQCYLAALAIWGELGMTAAAMEDTANRARLAWQSHQLAEAHQWAEACWAHVLAKGIEGMEFPVQVYLTCFDVFRAAERSALAHEALEKAHTLLLARANAISDAVLQEGMLRHVPANRRVVEEWEAWNEHTPPT